MDEPVNIDAEPEDAFKILLGVTVVEEDTEPVGPVEPVDKDSENE